MNMLSQNIGAIQWELSQEEDCTIIEAVDVPGDVRYIGFKMGSKDYGIYFVKGDIKKSDFPYHLVRLDKQVSYDVVKKEKEEYKGAVFTKKVMEQRVAIRHNLALDEVIIKVREL